MSDEDLDNDDKCPSCGVPYLRHLGLIGTCRALQAALADAATPGGQTEGENMNEPKPGDVWGTENDPKTWVRVHDVVHGECLVEIFGYGQRMDKRYVASMTNITALLAQAQAANAKAEFRLGHLKAETVWSDDATPHSPSQVAALVDLADRVTALLAEWRKDLGDGNDRWDSYAVCLELAQAIEGDCHNASMRPMR